MANKTARGYGRTINSAQAGQPVITRHEWDCEIQVATDQIKLGRLMAGHRLVPHLIKVIANGLQPVGNYDLCLDTTANTLINDQALLATTFTETGVTNTAAIEALGVSDTHRDLFLLINSGFATAPAGSKIILWLAQVPDI